VTHGRLLEEDIFARYGGEEFAIACRSTDLSTAGQLAERLRKAVEDVSIDAGTWTTLRVTASSGVAACPSDGIRESTSLINAAGRAMYRAKTNGLNRVEVAGAGSGAPPTQG
jgi:diguanylate cyclase (GGDEF)-like protein